MQKQLEGILLDYSWNRGKNGQTMALFWGEWDKGEGWWGRGSRKKWIIQRKGDGPVMV